MNVLNGGGKVSLVCTQANLDEMGVGDYNVIFREPIESDLKGWHIGVYKYVFECNVVKSNANYFSKKSHGYIQTILGLEIIDSSNKIIFDDDSIIDVDEYYYN